MQPLDPRFGERFAFLMGVGVASVISMALIGSALSHVGIHVDQTGPNSNFRTVLLGLALIGVNAAVFWVLFTRIIRRFGMRAFERTFYALLGALSVAMGQRGTPPLSYAFTLTGLAAISVQSFFPDWTLGAGLKQFSFWFFQRWPSLQWLDGSSLFSGVQTKAAKQKRIAALLAFGLAGIAFLLAVGGFWKNWFALVPGVACIFFGAVGLVLAANAVDDSEFIEVKPRVGEVE